MNKKFLIVAALALIAPLALAVDIVRGNLVTLWGVAPTLTPLGVASSTSAEQAFTVTGVKVGDIVLANKPTAQAGLGVVNVRVSAANTVAITFNNSTPNMLTPTSEAWSFSILRPEWLPLPTIVSP